MALAIFEVVGLVLVTVVGVVALVKRAQSAALVRQRALHELGRAREEALRELGIEDPIVPGGFYVSGHPNIATTQIVHFAAARGEIVILHGLQVLGRISPSAISGIEVVDKTEIEQRLRVKEKTSLTRVALFGGMGLLFPKTTVQTITTRKEAYVLAVEWIEDGIGLTAVFRYDGGSGLVQANRALSFLTGYRKRAMAGGNEPGPPAKLAPIPRVAPSYVLPVLAGLCGLGLIGNVVGPLDEDHGTNVKSTASTPTTTSERLTPAAVPPKPVCNANGRVGSCTSVSECRGQHAVGFCDGPDEIVCCLNEVAPAPVRKSAVQHVPRPAAGTRQPIAPPSGQAKQPANIGALYDPFNGAPPNGAAVPVDRAVGASETQPASDRQKETAPTGRITVQEKNAIDETTLTPDKVVSKIQAAYMTDLQNCYADHLKEAPSARGKITLSFTITRTGHVRGKAQGFAAGVNECMSGLMSSWQFTSPYDGDGNAVGASFEIGLLLTPE